MLAADERQPAVVFVDLGGVGRADVSTLFGFQFGDNVADARVGREVDAAAEPDADLGAVVAAQHGPVLEEGHFETEAGGGQRGGGSGDAATDNYEVVVPAVLGGLRQAERLAAEGG